MRDVSSSRPNTFSSYRPVGSETEVAMMWRPWAVVVRQLLADGNRYPSKSDAAARHPSVAAFSRRASRAGVGSRPSGSRPLAATPVRATPPATLPEIATAAAASTQWARPSSSSRGTLYPFPCPSQRLALHPTIWICAPFRRSYTGTGWDGPATTEKAHGQALAASPTVNSPPSIRLAVSSRFQAFSLKSIPPSARRGATFSPTC